MSVSPPDDIWPNSGHSLLRRDADGHLVVTDDFLRAYLQRPEVAPVEESCDTERALHARLMDEPRATVTAEQISRLADEDARDNYPVLIDFRDQLVAAGTVEACYAGLFRSGDVRVPPLFLDQMAQVIAQSILAGQDDPFRWRAAELLFREQNVTRQDGAVLLGDTETIEMLATTAGMGSLGRLVVDGGVDARQVDLDVMLDENAQGYWARADRYDWVLDLTFARPGLDALCRVLEAWVTHFTRAQVSIQPVETIRDEKWVWHLGLDAEATALLNDLYDGTDVGDERLAQLLSLFRLEFKDAASMRPDLAGKPIYMGLCSTPAGRLRLKPQNLLVNLPLAAEQ